MVNLKIKRVGCNFPSVPLAKPPLTFGRYGCVIASSMKPCLIIYNHFSMPLSEVISVNDRGPVMVTSPVTGVFSSQRPVTQSFDVFSDLWSTNRWASNQDAGDLRRHGAHYDVTVIHFDYIPLIHQLQCPQPCHGLLTFTRYYAFLGVEQMPLDFISII